MYMCVCACVLVRERERTCKCLQSSRRHMFSSHAHIHTQFWKYNNSYLQFKKCAESRELPHMMSVCTTGWLTFLFDKAYSQLNCPNSLYSSQNNHHIQNRLVKFYLAPILAMLPQAKAALLQKHDHLTGFCQSVCVNSLFTHLFFVKNTWGLQYSPHI